MARLTIDLPDSLHQELTTSAASLGISVHELVLQRIASAPNSSAPQNRWANLAATLSAESTMEGLSEQLHDKRTYFRDEFSTNEAGW